MSERTATWRIVTSFAKARKDSDSLAGSLERLDASKNHLDDSTVKGNNEVTKSTNTRTKTVQEWVKQSKAAQVAEGLLRKQLDDTTVATDKETASRKRGLGSLVQTLAAKRRLGEANKSQVRQSSALAAVENKLAAIELRRKQSVLALTAAENRHAAAVKKNGIFSDQAGKALLSLERRTLDLTHVEQQHSIVLQRVNQETLRTGNNSGGLGNKLRSLGGDFFSVGKSTSFFGKMIGLLKFPAMISGVGSLVAALSQLSAGLVSVIGPLSSLIGVAASLPAVFAVGAGVLGTFLGGLSGIGAAMKAHTAAQTAGAAASGGAAKAQNNQTAASNRLKKAQKALTQAQKELNTAQKEQQKTAAELAAAQKKAAAGANEQKLAVLDRKQSSKKLRSVLKDPNSTGAQKAAAKKALAQAKSAEKAIQKERAKYRKQAKDAENKDEKARSKVKSAQAKVNAAQKAQKNAQKALTKATKATQAATTGAAGAADQYAAAMAKLTPEGRKFVEVLIKAQAQLKIMRDAAQRGLLPGLGDALTTLFKLVPMVSDALETFGRIIGNTARKGADIATSGPFTTMFGRIIKSNEGLLRIAAKAFLNLFQAIVYVMDAARPFTRWLFQTIEGWTQFAKHTAKAGDAVDKFGHPIGKTAGFLEKTKNVMTILGHIMRNLFGTFKGLGKAGYSLGHDLLTSFAHITKGWSKWTNSMKGQNSLKKWFDAARPTLHQAGKLIGAVVKAFYKIGQTDKSTGPLIKRIRKELLPAIVKIVKHLKGNFGKSIVDALSSIADLIAALTGGGKKGGVGGLTSFVKTIGKVADSATWIVKNFPAATNIIGLLTTALGALAAIRFVGAITGLGKLTGLIGKSAKGGALKGLLGNKDLGADAKFSAKAGRKVKGGVKKVAKGLGGKVKSLFGGNANPEGEAQSLTARFGKALRSGLTKARNGIKSVASKVGKSLTDNVKGAIEKDSTKVKGAISKIGSGSSKAASKLKTVGSKLGKGLMDTTRKAIEKGAPLVKGAMSKMGGFISKAGSGLVSGLGRAVSAIGGVMTKLVGIVGKAMFAIGRFMLANPWILLVAALIIVAILIYKHWDKIKAIVKKAIAFVLAFVKKHWRLIVGLLLGPIAFVILQIIKHWAKIKEIFSKAIAWVLAIVKRVWDGLKDLLSGPIDAAKGLLSKIWDGIHTLFQNGFDKIKSAAESFKTAFGKIWDGLKNIFGAPIEWIINTVIGDWLVGNFNKVLDFLHVPAIPFPHVDMTVPGFARGGMVPGEGNRDSVPAVLMPGEYVLRKDAVKKIGLTNLTQMNEGRKTTGKKFAKGGAVGGSSAESPQKFGLGGLIHSGLHTITSVTGKAINLARSGAAAGLAKALSPIRALAEHNNFQGKMHDIPPGVTNLLADNMINFVKGKKPPPVAAKGNTTSAPHQGGNQDPAPKRHARGGYSRDGVDALLTPGEFVFGPGAVKRLGVRRLNQMNAGKRFSRGGPVRHGASMFGLGTGGSGFGSLMSPSMANTPSARALASAVGGGRGLAGLSVHAPTHVVYDIDVHNPAPERASDSVSGAVRRKTVRNGWSG